MLVGLQASSSVDERAEGLLLEIALSPPTSPFRLFSLLPLARFKDFCLLTLKKKVFSLLFQRDNWFSKPN